MEAQLTTIEDILKMREYRLKEAFEGTQQDGFSFAIMKTAIQPLYGLPVTFQAVATKIQDIYQKTVFNLPFGQRIYQITVRGEKGKEIDVWGYKGGIFVDNLNLKRLRNSNEDFEKRRRQAEEESTKIDSHSDFYKVDLLIEGKLSFRDKEYLWKSRKRVKTPEDNLVVLVSSVTSLPT